MRVFLFFSAHREPYSCPAEVHTSANLLNARGVAYTYLRDFQHALADFHKALELDPSHTLAAFNAGSVYMSQQQNTQALRLLDLACRSKEGEDVDADALGSRGVCRGMLGDMAGALEDLTAALAQCPTADALYNRAEIGGRLGNWQQARDDLRACAALGPADDMIRMKLAIAEAKAAMPH